MSGSGNLLVGISNSKLYIWNLLEKYLVYKAYTNKIENLKLTSCLSFFVNNTGEYLLFIESAKSADSSESTMSASYKRFHFKLLPFPAKIIFQMIKESKYEERSENN